MRTKQLGVRVQLLDRTDRGRRGEEGVDRVVLDHATEGGRVRRTHWLAFVEHGGGAGDQGGVDDVGVTHDPAHVGCREPHLAGVYVVDAVSYTHLEPTRRTPISYA